jgi:hypothetical protein
MSKKLYTYSIFRTNGEITVYDPQPKLDFRKFYEMIGNGCDTFQIVPKVYYPDGMNKRATAYCDENGLLTGQPDNPHFKTYHDPLFGDESNIVGNVMLEEVYHER